LRHLFGPGDRVLHLDLHPANVMLTAAGPVVIDWTNAAAGPAGADVALADLIMATADIDDLPGWLGRAFLRGFRRAVRDDPRPYLAEVARYRLADANIRPDEAERVRRLAALSPRAR
jgi:aminoglycoside phosphotransferase (APT) family kinase protein